MPSIKGLSWEPQAGNPMNILEYNGNIPTRFLIFHYIPVIFLGFPAWGFRFGVPDKVPL